MEDIEIFEKAIKKVQEKGFKCLSYDEMEYFVPNELIFSHDFAKAFFGEERIVKSRVTSNLEGEFYEPIAWQYYLQQMVLCEEPLKYLEKFLDK